MLKGSCRGQMIAETRRAYARDGVWVTGLSGPVKLITVGQSYVADGQKVRVALAP